MVGNIEYQARIQAKVRCMILAGLNDSTVNNYNDLMMVADKVSRMEMSRDARIVAIGIISALKDFVQKC